MYLLRQCIDLSASAPAWMTEVSEIVPGVHVARVVVNDDHVDAQVRMVNLGKEPATLTRNLLIGELHPVQVADAEQIGKQGQITSNSPVILKLMKTSCRRSLGSQGKVGEPFERIKKRILSHR